MTIDYLVEPTISKKLSSKQMLKVESGRQKMESCKFCLREEMRYSADAADNNFEDGGRSYESHSLKGL